MHFEPAAVRSQRSFVCSNTHPSIRPYGPAYTCMEEIRPAPFRRIGVISPSFARIELNCGRPAGRPTRFERTRWQPLLPNFPDGKRNNGKGGRPVGVTGEEKSRIMDTNRIKRKSDWQLSCGFICSLSGKPTTTSCMLNSTCGLRATGQHAHI